MKQIVFALLLLVVTTVAQNYERASVAPPRGSLTAVRDTCANFWTLAPAANGQRKLMVLPAQAATAWVEATIKGAEPAAWQTIRADEIGFVWLTQANRTVRFDPRKPQEGAREMAFTPST
ncbi:MAG: hypothetical protein HOP19_01930, partial [Acidobacteria bacterium]|nr:hypothetical protein [Acidobacteriota bacterium]